MNYVVTSAVLDVSVTVATEFIIIIFFSPLKKKKKKREGDLEVGT